MVLAGHSCTYFEFMEFIDGTNMKVPMTFVHNLKLLPWWF